MLLACLGHSSPPKMEAICFFETSVVFERTIRHYVPQCTYLWAVCLNMSGKEVHVGWTEGLHAVQPRDRVAALVHERQTWRKHRSRERSASYGMRDFRVLRGPSERFEASIIVITSLHIGTLWNGTACSWKMVWLRLKQAEVWLTGTRRKAFGKTWWICVHGSSCAACQLREPFHTLRVRGTWTCFHTTYFFLWHHKRITLYLYMQ
jgi:hypothetical protein